MASLLSADRDTKFLTFLSQTGNERFLAMFNGAEGPVLLRISSSTNKEELDIELTQAQWQSLLAQMSKPFAEMG